MLDITSVPVRNPNIIGRMTDDEAVLVMPQKGQVKVINEVGAVVWELIDGKRDVGQIVDEVCSQFDVDRVAAEADTLNFISELIKREIIFIPAT